MLQKLIGCGRKILSKSSITEFIFVKLQGYIVQTSKQNMFRICSEKKKIYSISAY